MPGQTVEWSVIGDTIMIMWCYCYDWQLPCTLISLLTLVHPTRQHYANSIQPQCQSLDQQPIIVPMHTIQTIGLWGVVYNSPCQEKSNFCIDDPLCGKSILLVAFMMMSWHGNTFCITGSLWENPLTKVQWWGALLFSLLSEYAVEHTVQLQLIWDIVMLMWCPCYGCIYYTKRPMKHSQRFSHQVEFQWCSNARFFPQTLDFVQSISNYKVFKLLSFLCLSPDQ